jgi:putative hemolysin
MENCIELSSLSTADENPFRLDNSLPSEKTGGVKSHLLRAAEKMLGLDYMARSYSSFTPSNAPEAFATKVLSHLNVDYEIAGGDMSSIPKSGPALVVANHPFGGLEGILLLYLLRKRRPDIKIMANSILKRVPELEDIIIGVNPYGGAGATRENVKSMCQATRWMKKGGLLLVFPAGDVSNWQLRNLRIADNRWDAGIARMARIANAKVVPLFLEGRNSVAFHLIGNLHPRIRTAMLPREILNKQGQKIRLWIGDAIPNARLVRLGSDDEIAHYLRLRSRMLGRKRETISNIVSEARDQVDISGYEDIIEASCSSLLVRDIEGLSAKQKLAGNADFDVYCADAKQIPNVLQEIGRLREITFRANGEGTGKEIDLDKFDHFYLHLFLWDRKEQKIAGAYRLGLSDKILSVHGKKGFYSRSLFKFRRAFLEVLNPAIELGRSFVCEEYQKSIAPLMLLWKGIGEFVVRNPRYAILFGPVSISGEYSSTSQQLLIDFIMADQGGDPLRKLVKPRTPFRGRLRPVWRKADLAGMGSIKEISELISIIEEDGKGAPVLMRHYLNLGGRMLGFNIDKQFGNCVDGLVVVDLRKTNPRILARYMGVEGAAQFLDAHAEPLPLAS